MKTMRKILASSVLGALVAVAGCAGSVDGSPIDKAPTYTPPTETTPSTPSTPTPAARRFVILHTNDEHSHLLGYGPESQYPWLPKLDADGKFDAVATVTAAKTAVATGSDTSTVGGIVRRQYLVNKLRSEIEDPVLLVSAGDSMMGTLMHLAAPTAAPDQLSMALLGYDFMTVGNHDFDWGAEAFAATLATAKTLTFGGSVPVIASNMKFGDVQAPTDSGYLLKTMVGAAGSGAPIVPYAIKTLANGLKIGVMGMMGYDAYLVTAAPGKVRFSVPTSGPACDASNACAAGTDCKLGHCVSSLDAAGHLQAEWKDAQATADALHAAKVDVVVLLSHLGIDEDMLLAQHTKGIDVIIGGHSHTEVHPTVVTSDLNGKSSIIVQAGSYGRLLGELAVTVSGAGVVSFDAAASDLLAVDHTLDAEIAADDAAVVEAMSLSGGVLAPVMAGLNQQIGGALGLPGKNLWGTMLLSTHDVLGEVSMADTNLSHFVTDAMYGTVTAAGATCPMASRLVVVEANGVLRDSLNFGKPVVGGKKTASAADIFRVSPLGASASDQSQPGYGVTMFNLAAAELYAGMDVGTTKGRQSDSFFLSYAGAQVTYDPTATPFDKTKTTDPTAVHGTIIKIAFGNDVAGYTDVIYDRAPGAPWASGWKVSPTGTLVTVVTNAYIAGFLQAFGFTPRDKAGAPIASADPTNSLAGVMLCVVSPPVAPDCAGTGAATIRRCAEGANHAPPWAAGFTELREWGLVMKYAGALGPGGLGNGQYGGDTPDTGALPKISRVLVSP